MTSSIEHTITLTTPSHSRDALTVYPCPTLKQFTENSNYPGCVNADTFILLGWIESHFWREKPFEFLAGKTVTLFENIVEGLGCRP